MEKDVPTASPPSRELVILREKVERLLSKAVPNYNKAADRFEIPYESTHLVIHPIDWTEGRTLLRLIAPVIVDVNPTPALYERLSELNNTTIFGKYYVHDRTVFIEHNLLGESADGDEFRAAIASVAHHADHLVDPMLAEFGGRKWKEDV